MSDAGTQAAAIPDYIGWLPISLLDLLKLPIPLDQLTQTL